MAAGLDYENEKTCVGEMVKKQFWLNVAVLVKTRHEGAIVLPWVMVEHGLKYRVMRNTRLFVKKVDEKLSY